MGDLSPGSPLGALGRGCRAESLKSLELRDDPWVVQTLSEPQLMRKVLPASEIGHPASFLYSFSVA